MSGLDQFLLTAIHYDFQCKWQVRQHFMNHSIVTQRKFISLLVATSVLTALAIAQAGQGRRGGRGGQRGGPPGVFHTEVPYHAIDVIQSRPTDTSVMLSILVAQDTQAIFSYTPGGVARALALKAGVPFEIEVADLQPDQAYQYMIAGESPLAKGTFRTARPAGVPFTFDVQADSHLDENTDPRVYTNTLMNIAADRPDFLIDLGDTFMTDKYANYQDAAPQYLAQRYYFGIVGQNAPVFLVLGNHDGEVGWRTPGGEMSAWSMAMRHKYFPPVRTNSFYSAGPITSNYYAWTWGDALFVVLDPFTLSQEKPRTDDDGWVRTLGRTQYDWLSKTLSSSHARYKFVFIHHLVGGLDKDSRGGVEASTFYEWGGENLDHSPGFRSHRAGWPMPIHELLVANHVSAVFHGHDHLYVRQQRDGIIYQEVPQPSSARENATNSAVDYGYTSGKLLGSPGHMRISIGAGGALVEYVKSRLSGTNAEVVDRYTIQPATKQ